MADPKNAYPYPPPPAPATGYYHGPPANAPPPFVVMAPPAPPPPPPPAARSEKGFLEGLLSALGCITQLSECYGDQSDGLSPDDGTFTQY